MKLNVFGPHSFCNLGSHNTCVYDFQIVKVVYESITFDVMLTFIKNIFCDFILVLVAISGRITLWLLAKVGWCILQVYIIIIAVNLHVYKPNFNERKEGKFQFQTKSFNNSSITFVIIMDLKSNASVCANLI